MMYYRLVFSKKSVFNNSLKITLLICGLFCDIAAFIGFLLSVMGSPIYLIMMFFALGVGIALRVVAVNLIFSVENKLQHGKLTITKIYPHKSIIVLSENINDIIVTPIDVENNSFKGEKSSNEIMDLATDFEDKYLISVNGMKVICNLDKYMYATLVKGEEI